MNEDYLWDKSGDPDPQVQQLEEILGTLRYQPKPLRIPAGASATRRRNYFPLLAAIAATVAIALLSAGVWLQLRSPDASIPAVAIASPPTRLINLSISLSPGTPKRVKPRLVKHDTPRDTQEALEAKQQLMFALRLASEKLNSAYRRTQSPNQIKNQHKAG